MNNIRSNNRKEYYFQFEDYIQSRLDKLAAPTTLSERLVNEPSAKELVKKLAFKLNKAQGKFIPLTDFRTICDLVYTDDDFSDEYRALIECKCWYKPAFNDSLAELIARLDTDKPCIKMQWDLLARSNKPYLIIIGYHSKSDIHIKIKANKISNLIDEYLIISGLGNEFTVNKCIDIYNEYFLDSLEIVESGGDIGNAILLDRLYNPTLLKNEFMQMIDNELGDQTAVNYQAINWTALLNCESDNMNKDKLITDINNLTKYLTDRYLAGETTGEILSDLKNQGYLNNKREQLIAADISRYVAPKKLISTDFRPYLNDIKKAFKKASYESDINLHDINDEEAELLGELFKDKLDYKKGSGRIFSRDTYKKWYVNHYQADLFKQCKSEVLEELRTESRLTKQAKPLQTELTLSYVTNDQILARLNDLDDHLDMINQKLNYLLADTETTLQNQGDIVDNQIREQSNRGLDRVKLKDALVALMDAVEDI